MNFVSKHVDPATQRCSTPITEGGRTFLDKFDKNENSCDSKLFRGATGLVGPRKLGPKIEKVVFLMKFLNLKILIFDFLGSRCEIFRDLSDRGGSASLISLK